MAPCFATNLNVPDGRFCSLVSGMSSQHGACVSITVSTGVCIEPHLPCYSMAAARCCGITKSGQQCSITSLSKMRDSAGRFVADPLRRGATFCMMHTVLFCRRPLQSCESIVAYIDLETNSSDVSSGKIVEIGALIDGSRFMFSSFFAPGPRCFSG